MKSIETILIVRNDFSKHPLTLSIQECRVKGSNGKNDQELFSIKRQTSAVVGQR